MIAQGVQAAIAQRGRIKPYKFETPVKVPLQFESEQEADNDELFGRSTRKDRPGIRVDDRTFEATITSLLDPNLAL